MSSNLLIVHGGAPTAVINSSLFGVITEARKYNQIDQVFGAKNGLGGVLKEDFLNLSNVGEQQLKLLLKTPGSAIGTSRDPLEKEDYKKIVSILKKNHINYVLLNGGNGTMGACGEIYKACQETNENIQVIGIPKTIDNDISITDHSPGFGSAARYIAKSVREVCCDVRGLPIHVVVIEALGRNAGWITAASALADPSGKYGPDLIYVPEIAFDEQRFLQDIKELLKKKTSAVVVVSEGLHDKNNSPIVAPIFKSGRSVYYGDVSSYLANLIIKELGYKARSEKPGLLGRASIELQSEVDANEAVYVGQEAVKALIDGQSGKMISLKRIESSGYKIIAELAEIKEVMLYERTLPLEYINAEGNGVTEAFIKWCSPLIGAELEDVISFN